MDAAFGLIEVQHADIRQPGCNLGMGWFVPQGVIRNDFTANPSVTFMSASIDMGGAWHDYGRTTMGTRFATADQIGPDNVAALEVAWTFRYDTPPVISAEDQNTPLYANGLVYSCTPYNVVNALDGTSGEAVWSFDPLASSPIWERCRGVTYYEPSPLPNGEGPVATTPALVECPRRIVLNTINGRLIMLDADSGALCAGFGVAGTVDLNAHLGDTAPGMYIPTSAPTVVNDLVISDGWIFDGQYVGEPSGVLRAWDARTGDLRWAWDLGNPEINLLPPEGETYTLGTPNVWSKPTYDPDLNMIYLPLGNATPDFWGAHRSEESEEYTSSVVALNADTGREVWHFRTVNHDIWDYDLPAQPSLYDLPDGTDGTIPALILPTKQG